MNKLYHIGISEDLQVKYALLPGDPARVAKIAKFLDNAKPLAQSREYTSYIGSLLGENVLVMSTGMGGPSAAIAIEELAHLGVDTVIRVGSTGGIALDVQAGDVVIANSAIRMEGTTREYIPIEFPAVANAEVLYALTKASINNNINYHIGVVHSKDSFYGQHDPARMPVAYELESKWQAWKRSGVLASEMECAAIFVVSHYLKIRAGAVLHVLWNKDREDMGMPSNENYDTTNAIETAVHAMKLLIESDLEGRSIYE